MNDVRLLDFKNDYWKSDPNKFRELSDIVNLHPFSVTQQLKKHHEGIISWIDIIIPETLPDQLPNAKMLTKVFWILNNLHDFPECENCKKHIVMDVRGLKSGYPRFCSHSCSTSAQTTVANHKATCEKKHGNPNFTNRAKAWKTTYEHFGVLHPQDDPTIRAKTRKTNIQKYGTPTYMASDDFREKSQKTMLEEYGVKNIMQSEGMPDVVKNTKSNRYGDPNFNNRDKYSKTMLDTYGVDHNFKTEEHKKLMHDNRVQISQKKRQTLNKNFGRDFTIAPKYKFRDTIFDSAPELAYFIWLSDHNIDFTYQPDIHFKFFGPDQDLHLYFPDFLVSGNLVEIKGDHFFRDNDPSKDMICPFNRSKDALFEAKHRCMIEHNVQILTSKDYKTFIDYVKKAYGKDFFQTCKIQKSREL